MSSVRLGIVGLGAMGGFHARTILEGKVPRCVLAAICDRRREHFAKYSSLPAFTSVDELLDREKVDALLIATPHCFHSSIGIKALRAGLHVLVEKPIATHKLDAENLVAAHKGPQQVFAAMFNQRTDPYFVKLREFVKSGRLGEIRRVHWTITDWFRTEAYYRSGEWRATWAGEGGGVLLNQCPHNLDLYQWIFGMPTLVRAFCKFGRYHDIEVEDDVIAYFEHSSGPTAVLIASTGETPGTNRLEVAAERGRVVIENDQFTFSRNELPMSEFSRSTPDRFARPATSQIAIPFSGHGPQHQGILENFAAAILEGAPLIAPAAEGINSLELANACLLSTWENRTVELPLEGKLYEQRLQQRVKDSDFKKPEPVSRATSDDMGSSFR